MKMLLVARKSLREIVREPQLIGLELGLPLVFLLMTLLMYNTPLLVTYQLWVHDPGERAGPIIEELREQRYPNGEPVFELTAVENLHEAEEALKERASSLLLKVSPYGGGVSLRGDALSPAFYRASVLLEAALRQQADRTAGRPQVARLAVDTIAAGGGRSLGPQTQFDLYAPGMIVFALLMIIPQTAMLVSREVRWRTLERLQLAPVSTAELLAGICLAQLVVVVLQVVTITWLATALGFHGHGSKWLAVLAGLVLSLGSIALGLIVAACVENDSQAANLGGSISMLLVFVSGAWFAMPALTLFTLLGHPIDLFDVFPATSGFLALQQVLAYGAGLREVAFRLAVTFILSVVYFGIGVLVFRHLRMQKS